MRPIPLCDLPDPELPDTSYLPFRHSGSLHRQALEEARIRAGELAAKPPATRFLLLREDGSEAREFGDLSDARAWQRASVRYLVVIADDGRLMSYPNMSTEAFALEVVERWRERGAVGEPESGVIPIDDRGAT